MQGLVTLAEFGRDILTKVWVRLLNEIGRLALIL